MEKSIANGCLKSERVAFEKRNEVLHEEVRITQDHVGVFKEDKTVVQKNAEEEKIVTQEQTGVLTEDSPTGVKESEVIGSFETQQKDELNLIKFIKQQMGLPDTDIKSYSPLALAYIGDAIYDLVIRTMIVEKGNAPVNKLHKQVSSLVKASAQKDLLHKIEKYLTEDELAAYKRGRNSKSFTTAKNATVADYRVATGLEALIGYLYLTNQFRRILELIGIGLQG